MALGQTHLGSVPQAGAAFPKLLVTTLARPIKWWITEVASPGALGRAKDGPAPAEPSGLREGLEFRASACTPRQVGTEDPGEVRRCSRHLPRESPGLPASPRAGSPPSASGKAGLAEHSPRLLCAALQVTDGTIKQKIFTPQLHFFSTNFSRQSYRRRPDLVY